jgi:hypothetical protein
MDSIPAIILQKKDRINLSGKVGFNHGDMLYIKTWGILLVFIYNT